MDTDTEYTQSGNSRFLAYISSWWKNQPWLLGGRGGARPPPFTQVTITYKVAVCAPAERADTIPLFSSIPLYVLCVTKYFQLALESWQDYNWSGENFSNWVTTCLVVCALRICMARDLLGAPWTVKTVLCTKFRRKLGPIKEEVSPQDGKTPRFCRRKWNFFTHWIWYVRHSSTLRIQHNRFRLKQKADIA